MPGGTASTLLGIAVLCLLLALASLALGSVRLPLGDILASTLGRRSVSIPESTRVIVRQVRIPRTLTAVGVGGSLGIAGLIMQTVFRNALAGPGVLGVTSGAGLGVALVMLTGIGARVSAPAAVAAVLGAASVLGLALLVHRLVGNVVVLLVLGLLFGYAASAATAVLLSFSGAEGIQRYVVWGFGSFALPGGAVPATLCLATGAAAAVLIPFGSRLDILLLGASYAESSGVPARAAHAALIAVAGVLTGLVTAFAGPISFLGVAVPHVARAAIHTSRHAVLVPAVTLIGAGLALAGDIVARLPGIDYVLPLNSVTALIGVPIVVAVVVRSQRAGGGGGLGL
jgi:iron complex transport system permease protein